MPNKLMQFQTQKGPVKLLWTQILRCESSSNYCTSYLLNGKKLLLSKTLGSIQAMLLEDQFYRIHHSHLIRLDALKKVSSLQVTLINEERLPIARSRKSAFFTFLGDEMFLGNVLFEN